MGKYGEGIAFPKMALVEQIINQSKIDDVAQETQKELRRIKIENLINEGEKIGITVGSRGMDGLIDILQTLIDEVRAAGGEPFIIPTMGSHGGGTVEGQREILESLGVSEETLKVPIEASAETVQIGETDSGVPVFVNDITVSARMDKIILFNRVKEHTEFEGDIESGIHKMCAIGIGNPTGALTVHQSALDIGFAKTIIDVGGYIIEHLPVAFALATVENYYHETSNVRAMLPGEIFSEEKELLKIAKGNLGKLPFDKVDVLIVDELGKNVSGSGLDTNVIGRIMNYGQKEPEKPDIKRIIILDVTEESHGTASGMGLADFTTKRLVDKISNWPTFFNCITAQTPAKGRMPIYFDTDKESVGAALVCIGRTKSEEARVIHIKNTTQVGTMEISESLVNEMGNNKNLKLIGDLEDMKFDVDGNIPRI